MIIDIDYKQMVKFLGRNGMANQSGISVSLTEADGIVTLQPFTGKGNIGKGFLEIPPDAIPAVIAALQKVAGLVKVGDSDMRRALATHNQSVADSSGDAPGMSFGPE